MQISELEDTQKKGARSRPERMQALAAGAALAANAGRVAAGGPPARKLTGYETTEIIESELPDTRLPDTEIAETELLDDEPTYPALSATQYGELR